MSEELYVRAETRPTCKLEAPVSSSNVRATVVTGVRGFFVSVPLKSQNDKSQKSHFFLTRDMSKLWVAWACAVHH